MKLSHDDRASIDFVLTLRRRWADAMYPALRAQYDARTRRRAPRGRKEATPVVHGLPSYRWFAWMERGAQKMLWRAVSDAIARHGKARAKPSGPARLELDPSLELPEWYSDWDIHVQPGGVWKSDASADVYELGAKLVMLGVNDDYTFHRAFVQTAIPPRGYRRIVDMGCGFGKSTWPFKRAFPEAEVIGVDLAAPCLALAAERASAQGLDIRFRQADCARTGLEDGSADLVTSTMLVHEMPRPHLEATLHEAARLLAPGGLLRFLDFTWTGDAFRDVALAEHGARNNEPFMPGSMGADMDAICRKAGLEEARWVAFDERGGGRLDRLEWPARPEWHFPWAVLEARKPGMSTTRRKPAASAKKAPPELAFLEGVDVDRLAALVFELSSQLHVERHRRMALERALVAKGVVAEAEIAALAEDQAFLGAAREAADRSLRKLLRILAEDGDRRAPLRKEAL